MSYDISHETIWYPLNLILLLQQTFKKRFSVKVLFITFYKILKTKSQVDQGT